MKIKGQPTCAGVLCRRIYSHWKRQRSSVLHIIDKKVRPLGSHGHKRTLANFRNSQLPEFLQDVLVELAEGAINLNTIQDKNL